MWGLAVIVVVIVSWLMYRYLAPDSWKEWARAGVLQAFNDLMLDNAALPLGIVRYLAGEVRRLLEDRRGAAVAAYSSGLPTGSIPRSRAAL
jgi:hypothetical protein